MPNDILSEILVCDAHLQKSFYIYIRVKLYIHDDLILMYPVWLDSSRTTLTWIWIYHHKQLREKVA